MSDKNSAAYNAIAPLYERLMDVDYDVWANYEIEFLKEYSKGNKGVDAGCGSGAFTRRFRRAGFDVIGADISEEMLSVAAETSRREGLDIKYVKQDIRSLKLPERVHFITALTDCFNYVDGAGMRRALSRFHSSLVKGGVLAFDISTEYKLKELIGNGMFGEDAEDYSYLWFNRTFEGGVEMDISLFTKTADGKYEKREEHHTQYVHREQDVLSALDAAGFEVIKVEGHLGAPVSPDCERLNFFAVRK